MHSFLTQAGLALLQASLTNFPNPPTIALTGAQVGSASGFTPTEDLTTAQGTILVDRRVDLTSVQITKIHMHEIIVSAVMDRDLEFDAIGNVVFYANDTPILWLVSEQQFGKLKTNPVSHFAGDKTYLSIVFRFPYIQKLIAIDPSQNLYGKWQVFSDIRDMIIPQHTLSEQCVVEKNSLFYGNQAPFIAARTHEQWLSNPLMRPADSNFYRIDGGQTLTGQ